MKERRIPSMAEVPLCFNGDRNPRDMERSGYCASCRATPGHWCPACRRRHKGTCSTARSLAAFLSGGKRDG